MTNFYDGFESWNRRLAEQARSAFDVHARALAACDDFLNGSRRALGMYEESQAASLRMANTVFSDDALSRYIDDITLPGAAVQLLPEFGLSQVEEMLLAQEMPAAMKQLQEAERGMEHWFAQYGDRGTVEKILRDIEEQTRQAQQVMGSPEFHLGWNSADYLERWANEAKGWDAATRRILDSLDLHHFDRSARELEEWMERARSFEARPTHPTKKKLSSDDVAKVRRAMWVALMQLAHATREFPAAFWVLLNAWYLGLSPVGKLLLAGAVGVGMTDARDALVAKNSAAPHPIPVTYPKLSRPEPRRAELLTSVKAVRIYLGPHTTQRFVTTVPPLGLMRVQHRQFGWYQVLYVPADGDGAFFVGWVKATSVRPLDRETTQLLGCVLPTPTASTCKAVHTD